MFCFSGGDGQWGFRFIEHACNMSTINRIFWFSAVMRWKWAVQNLFGGLQRIAGSVAKWIPPCDNDLVCWSV